MTLLACLFALFCSLLLPLGAGTFLALRTKKAAPVLLGAACFTVFQLLTRIPLLQVVLPRSAAYALFQASHPTAYLLLLCLSAGVFEECGRALTMRLFLRTSAPADAVSFGVGHGGIEAIALVGVSMIGIAESRVIDERVNRLTGSEESYTFHGRDVYAFTGARLASGVISFGEVGPEVPVDSIVELPTVPPTEGEGFVSGTIDVLDIRFGSLWTNIPREMFKKLGIPAGGRAEITIQNDTRTLYRNILTYAHSFAEVYVGEPLIYVNSLDCMAVAINQGSFAKAYNIGTGNSWKITIRRDPRG